MSSWSHGYNVSGGYTYGFYREIAPGWLDFVALSRGYVAPRRAADGGFRYLELGCGQGVGLILLAAANPTAHFVGVDFHPEHVAHARALIEEAGLTNVEVIEGDFLAMGAHWPEGLGQFDYVVLHGIYSWVPQEVRQAIVSCLAAGVAPGGLAYISYNCAPGWLSTAPLQHMLMEMHRRGAAAGAETVRQGQTLFKAFNDLGLGVTSAFPLLQNRLASMERQDPAYLVQEYLHENWFPLWFSQVNREVASAKLGWIGSATLADNLLPALLPEKARTLVAEWDKGDASFRQDLIDCLITQTFRRDVFCRGPRRRFQMEQAWEDHVWIHRCDIRDVPDELTISTSIGTLKLNKAAYAPIIDAITDQPRSFSDLLQVAAANNQNRAGLLQTLYLLAQDNWLTFGPGAEQTGSQARAINRVIARRVAEGATYRHLAATKAGTAIASAETELLLLDATLAEPAPKASLEQLLITKLGKLGRRLARSGEALSESDAQLEAKRLTMVFRDETTPRWQKLGVM